LCHAQPLQKARREFAAWAIVKGQDKRSRPTTGFQHAAMLNRPEQMRRKICAVTAIPG
jgi:hypothetical protein